MNRPLHFTSLIVLLLITLSACAVQPASPEPETFSDPYGFFPTLKDPEGAHKPGGGGGGNSDKRGMGFDLVTDLPLEDVQEHYAAQLEDAGWVKVSQKDKEGAISSYWELVDEGGKTWPVMLEISGETISDEADYYVELRAVSPP